MTDIKNLIDNVISKEGGYSNDPKDPGGETMFGVTFAQARAFGYQGEMKSLPRATAAVIYEKLYWIEPWFDKIDLVDPSLAEKLFDTGINCGTGFASKSLQRCLTVLNNEGKDYPDLTPDGRIGSMTIAALQAFIKKRGKDGIATIQFMVAACQAVRYIELAEAKGTNESFLYGWEKNRALYKSVP